MGGNRGRGSLACFGLATVFVLLRIYQPWAFLGPWSCLGLNALPQALSDSSDSGCVLGIASCGAQPLCEAFSDVLELEAASSVLPAFSTHHRGADLSYFLACSLPQQMAGQGSSPCLLTYCPAHGLCPVSDY